MVAAELIKKYRKVNGLTQIQMADKLFVTRSLISMWENGARKPEGRNLENLARLLNIDETELLDNDADKEKYKREKERIDKEISEFIDVDGAEVSDADATELLTAFLNSVSEKDYNVFMSRYFSYRSCREIAEEYGMNESTVRGKLARIRKKLKKFSEKSGKNDREEF